MIRTHSKHKTMPPWPSLNCNLLSPQLHLIAVFLLAFQATSALNNRETCPDHFWLDTDRDACVDCTVCDKQSVIVLRPCQPHKDTVCGTFKDLESNWSWLIQTESSITTKWRERRKEVTATSNGDNDNTMWWDWQAASFALAAIACLLFFTAAAYILYQHARQWRQVEKMDRRFDRDVEALSARLMHSIVDIKSIENGRIVLQETSRDRIFNPREVRCVYLEKLLVGNELINSSKRGNVYIEETKGGDSMQKLQHKLSD